VRITGRVFVVLLSSMLGGCLATSQNASLTGTPGIDKPGTTVKVNNPDFNKWVLRRAGQTPVDPRSPLVASTKMTIWTCRPLACSGNAVVGIVMAQSPTRHPDRVALEKAAKLLSTQAKAQDLVADAASEGDIRITPLSSKVMDLRGYPAIVAESKRTTRGKASYTIRSDIFVGSALVKLTAISYDRQEAKRSFDAFLASIEINDMESPAPPPAPSADPVALDGPTAPVIPTSE
jgi:hypothetical protein